MSYSDLGGKCTRRILPLQENEVVANELLLKYYSFSFLNSEAAVSLGCKSIVENRLYQEIGLIADLISSLLSIFSAFLCLFLLISCLECDSTILFLSTPVNEYDIKGVVIFAITLISFFDIAVINSLFYSFYSIDSL